MRVLVPFDACRPKTRLSPVLSESERHDFARRLLADVLSALTETAHDPTVLANGSVEADVPVQIDEQPLTQAVNAALPDSKGELPIAIVMADLGLATADALEGLFVAGRSRNVDVAIVPGIGGGTNALVIDHPDFQVDYHGVSYRDHREHARDLGATVETVDSYRLSVDIDDPSDLPELLLHGRGTARTWLHEAGFAVGEAGTRRIDLTRAESDRGP